MLRDKLFLLLAKGSGASYCRIKGTFVDSGNMRGLNPIEFVGGEDFVVSIGESTTYDPQGLRVYVNDNFRGAKLRVVNEATGKSVYTDSYAFDKVSTWLTYQGFDLFNGLIAGQEYYFTIYNV